MAYRPQAFDPDINVVVSASAGSGKTYLLVTRLLKLLLTGTRPDSILAITFTRKAAAEMRMRLMDKLWQLATCDDEQLRQELHNIQLQPDASALLTARKIYEQVLFASSPIRITTYHAFCQDILQRFPMEAGIPPGFEVLAQNGLVVKQAIDTLYRECTLEPQGDTATALQALLQLLNGQDNTDQALKRFLDQRTNWWAYCRDFDDVIPQAVQQLTTYVPLVLPPVVDAHLKQQLQRYADLLLLLKTKPHAANADLINATLPGLLELSALEVLLELRFCLLTAKDEPRVIKESAVEKKLGEQTPLFFELKNELTDWLQQAIDAQRSEAFHAINKNWYTVGHHLVAIYQRLKNEQRFLDYNDLEWGTYWLLQHSDNALWLQYKLDQRIDHLLIDEFQDTNPIQWNLVLPLMEEMIASDADTTERLRSTFIVGDEKQAIYRFRGANAELQSIAQTWLTDRAQAQTFPLSQSWRSSPAIMDLLNAVFVQGPLRAQLPDFPRHHTHKDGWGHVEVMPLIQPDKAETASDNQSAQTDDTAQDPLRNPLTTAREEAIDRLAEQEAEQVALKIKSLMQSAQQTGQSLRYQDIYILFRQKIKAEAFEKIFDLHNIPYSSLFQKSLLDHLEISDLYTLLRFLMSPFDNHGLAQILVSPLFNATEQDLQTLAWQYDDKLWWQRLGRYAKHQEAASVANQPDVLTRAYTLLTHWMDKARFLPVHDLLDCIYHEGQVLQRYINNTPPEMVANVVSRLEQFVNLALTIDSGRYPSITRFLARVGLMNDTQEIPEQALSANDQVQFMTIHKSKGLEADIVFLVDSASDKSNTLSGECQVNWPATASKPEHFYWIPSIASQPSGLSPWLTTEDRLEQRQRANLLYVALSRARHAVYVTGHEKKTLKPHSWYSQIRQAVQVLAQGDDTDHCDHSAAVSYHYDGTSSHKNSTQLDLSLGQPQYHYSQQIDRFVEQISDTHVINPSRRDDIVDINNEKESIIEIRYGKLVHQLLEWMADPEQVHTQQVELLATSFEADYFQQAVDEATTIIQNSELKFLFAPEVQAYKEVNIAYQDPQSKQMIRGVIDRVIIADDAAWVIDFKTTRHVNGVQDYAQQLNLYTTGLQKQFPNLTIHSGIVFTHAKKLSQHQ